MHRLPLLSLCAAAVLAVPAVHASEYSNAIAAFKTAGESSEFFHKSYAYAVFPDVGEGGVVVGGVLGKGRVYSNGRLLGSTKMGGLTVGFQAGGKVYSEIIFFEDKRALDEFEQGKFEFAAGTSATAITASVGASAGTNGVQANASGTSQNATTVGAYANGMAVFTVAKGGLMYAATVGGQKFSFTPRGSP
jgi:lipid-binding SYLF domain-containing protein